MSYVPTEIRTSTTLRSLVKNWNEVSREFRPSAFWFWNSPMSPEEIQRTIHSIAENDIREILFHPIHGMELEYMSNEYFDRMRLALQLARQYDLKVWIYDDYGWPSGNVGGKLLARYPEHKGWYLEFRRDDSGTIKARPVCSDMLMDNAVGAPWANRCKGQMDTLSNQAVDCFIQMTYQRMFDSFGEYFGKTITGFFTDEPATMVPNAPSGNLWNSPALPWTPNLPELFLDRFGYDIESRYAELGDEAFSQIKTDYWQLVKELYSEAYHGQIGRWCREHNVKYTGHLAEDLPLQQVCFTGSVFQSLQHMDQPGIDQLMYNPAPEGRFVEQVLIPSVTRHCGKSKTYCEAWGISQFDLRPGQMVKQAEMLGIHGINDIALMGFHQAVDGIRKYTYWPPMFDTAPWWPWFGEFRDAFARAVSLGSMGKRKARYAILYPQNHLEQTSVFTDIFNWQATASRVIKELGLTVYEAGETFEFVFPEILDQAEVVDSQICFPNVEYDAILAPSDLNFFPASVETLNSLKNQGGNILCGTLEEVKATIGKTTPLWRELVGIVHNGQAGNLRVYSFEYSDGYMLAFRNIFDQSLEVYIDTEKAMAEWRPGCGICQCVGKQIVRTLEPNTTLWLSLTDCPIGQSSEKQTIRYEPVRTELTVHPEKPNLAVLSNIQFHCDDKWVDGVSVTLPGSTLRCRQFTIPELLRGRTKIHFRGTFDCESLPDELAIIFEAGHLASLCVNGRNVNLLDSVSLPLWDRSCRSVDIRALAVDGSNEVTGELAFQAYEMEMISDAFFNHYRPMPSCDLFLAGTFNYAGNGIRSCEYQKYQLPLDLADLGWSMLCGTIKLSAIVDVTHEQAGRICGLEIDLFEEDVVEILWDGNSLGQKIMRPYRFELPPQEVGNHTLEIKLAGTAANWMCEGVPWGVSQIRWNLTE